MSSVLLKILFSIGYLWKVRNSIMTLLKKIIQKQKLKNHKDAKPINLEALVNSGRVRIENKVLKKIEDRSRKRKNQ